MPQFPNIIEMCTSPRWITTSAHAVDYKGLRRIRMLVPCGQCPQCRQKNALEWSTRSFMEGKRFFQKYPNSFVLFDTLTYDVVPTFKDVYPPSWGTAFADKQTFDYKHVKDFLKLLRIRLKRLGYAVDERLRYFISSEFGGDQLYIDDRGRKRQASNRPHYHVLFFVAFPIDVLKLSQMISECWKHGRTDGLPYKQPYYVMTERTFRKLDAHCMNKLMYVQKYINKDNLYNRRQLSICRLVMDAKHGNFWQLKNSFREEFQRLVRLTCVRHFQSIGFGFAEKKPDVSQFLCDNEFVEKYGCLSWQNVNNGDCVFRDLPGYYENKLFKCDVPCYGGHRRIWTDNALGYLRVKYDKLRKRIFDDFNACYLNTSHEGRKYIDDCLDGRSVDKYVDYIVSYRGRLGNPSGDPYKDWLRGQLSLDGYVDDPDVYTCFLYCGKSDKIRFGDRYWSWKYYGVSSSSGYDKYGCQNDIKYMVDPSFRYDLNRIDTLPVIDQYWSHEFRYFDDIADFIGEYSLVKSLEKSAEIREKDFVAVAYRESKI